MHFSLATVALAAVAGLDLAAASPQVNKPNAVRPAIQPRQSTAPKKVCTAFQAGDWYECITRCTSWEHPGAESWDCRDVGEGWWHCCDH